MKSEGTVMKKIISFEKEIDFPSMIGEISSISIDNNLKFIDESNIDGNLSVYGSYKMTEASTLEEEFKYDLPVDISLTEKVDYKDAKISIDDFHYEIKNDDVLKCNIDILIDAVEEIVIEDENEIEIELVEDIDKLKQVDKEDLEAEDTKIENIDSRLYEEDNSIRECDGDTKEEKELDIEPINSENILEINENKEIEEKENMKEEKKKNISSLFEVLNEAEETFTTYSIYIFRKEDTIENIMDKYKVTKEELSNYNDLNNIEIGSKIVIPQALDE